MKGIKNDTNSWKDVPCSWIARLNIVKMTMLPRAVYRFSAISVKFTMAFFTELQQGILEFVWKHRRLQIAKRTLGKRNRAEKIIIPNFRLYYKATVIKTV